MIKCSREQTRNRIAYGDRIRAGGQAVGSRGAAVIGGEAVLERVRGPRAPWINCGAQRGVAAGGRGGSLSQGSGRNGRSCEGDVTSDSVAAAIGRQHSSMIKRAREQTRNCIINRDRTRPRGEAVSSADAPVIGGEPVLEVV